MPTIACPTCHETDRLAGKRRPGDSLEVTCQACGSVWERGARDVTATIPSPGPARPHPLPLPRGGDG